jgi:hypothetical protein
LTYHCPIYHHGENIWDPQWQKQVSNSIIATGQEADLVDEQLSLKSEPIVIVHLTNFIPISRLPISAADKFEMMKKTEAGLLTVYEKEFKDLCGCKVAVENSYPKYDNGYAITGPFHPKEIIRLHQCGIGTVLDLSHYQLYSNYITHGTGNQCGDLDRQIYGSAPAWQECIAILSSSLLQLHISNARGMNEEGEGLPVDQGEIEILGLLSLVSSSIKRLIQGTIELGEGHLYSSKLQLKSALWLVKHLPAGVVFA